MKIPTEIEKLWEAVRKLAKKADVKLDPPKKGEEKDKK